LTFAAALGGGASVALLIVLSISLGRAWHDRATSGTASSALPQASLHPKKISTVALSKESLPSEMNLFGKTPLVPPVWLKVADAGPTTSLDSLVRPASAVLYEAASASAEPRRYDGATVWSLEPVKDGSPQADPTLHARVDIPNRLIMDWSLRPNPDARVPASHFMELRYRAGGKSDRIAEIKGIALKNAEDAVGKPLAVYASKVSDAYFLILLSPEPGDKKRNLELLSDNGWIDIIFVYESGKRGIVTLSRSDSGAKLVRRALQQWTHIVPTAQMSTDD
jgi:hypothetical protein